MLIRLLLILCFITPVHAGTLLFQWDEVTERVNGTDFDADCDLAFYEVCAVDTNRVCQSMIERTTETSLIMEVPNDELFCWGVTAVDTRGKRGNISDILCVLQPS